MERTSERPGRRKGARLLLGAHMSVAGGVHLAFSRGEEAGCTAIQLFTANPTRWRSRRLETAELSSFEKERGRHAIWPVVSHAGYLINLASADGQLREKSVSALVLEVERCGALGIPSVILHPGSHGGAGEEAGLRRVGRALDEVLGRTGGWRVAILLENTAGQGHSLGHRFEHLGLLLDELGAGKRLGVCLDTAHAFAAGYDLRTPVAYRETVAALDRAVGLSRVGVIHVNDARRPLGSRVDRHEHIGRGFLGLEAFRRIMRDPRFEGVPKILETPKTDGEREMDRVNIELLRRLAGKGG